MTEKTLTKQTNWGKLWHMALFIALPLAVGGLSAAWTGEQMSRFGAMNQPPLSPPAWLFPVAWTILYVLMGIASWLIWARGQRSVQPDSRIRRQTAQWLGVYALQLFFNFCWSPVFFNLGWFWFALLWLLVMWAMIIWLVVKARELSVPAMWMMIPYLLWTTFAAYLNLGIALLN